MPIPGVTSCVFGGPELHDLFITTRSGRAPEMVKSVGVPEAMMESTGPAAGALHICRPGVAGLPMLAFPG
jgi:sugar lactone lactonase YvrE